MPSRTQRAAGGVIYRVSRGEAEFLVARRPRYKDWTLPKGKLDPGEGPQEAALREVREETGYSCRTVAEVGSIGYQLRSGRRKAVRYWLMRAEEGKFEVNAEVDKVRWLSASDAAKRLSYRKDRAVLARGSAMVAQPKAGIVHLVRHAAAGTRTKSKSDAKRKLSKKGLRQADKLGRRLAREPIVTIRTSGYTRCLQTIQPLGRSLAIAVDKDERLAEGESLKGLLRLIRESAGTTVAVCTHNDMIGRLMKHLAAEGIDLGGVDEWRKASVWTFETQKGRITSGSYHKPPA